MFEITPFDRIDAAQEYLMLLNETVSENRQKIDVQITETTIQTSAHCVEMLKLAAYNLESLARIIHIFRDKESLFMVQSRC